MPSPLPQVVLAAALFAGLPAAAPAIVTEDPALLAELLAVHEQIAEAIRTGDRELLARHCLDEMLLVNRDGRTYDLAEFQADLSPPRPGYDLRFTALEPRVRRAGDAAVLTLLLDEYLTIYGVDVSTQYRTSLVFFRRDGAWKVALYEYFEKPVEPATVTLTTAELDALAGTYEIAPGRWVTVVRRVGDHLVASRDGGPERELRPFAPDRFFYPGVEGEIFFVRDSARRVTGMAFRRNFKDVPYRRLEPARG